MYWVHINIDNLSFIVLLRCYSLDAGALFLEQFNGGGTHVVVCLSDQYTLPVELFIHDLLPILSRLKE